MRSIRWYLCVAACALSPHCSMTQGGEIWGRVQSVDTRFAKVSIRHEGVYDTASFRIGPDTDFRFPDGVVRKRVDLRSLVGRPIFVTVEEVAGRYARKVWILPEPPHASGPIVPVGRP
ncbi:MAG: hypothetical protein EXS05_12695 [Planctomycetaceae bacterium]|nr:hypothetical protein [Planctomycetaceae bacterium]